VDRTGKTRGETECREKEYRERPGVPWGVLLETRPPTLGPLTSLCEEISPVMRGGVRKNVRRRKRNPLLSSASCYIIGGKKTRKKRGRLFVPTNTGKKKNINAERGLLGSQRLPVVQQGSIKKGAILH